MITENTLDMARLKVHIPKFAKWIMDNYSVTPKFNIVSDVDNFFLSDALKKVLVELDVQELYVDRIIAGPVSLKAIIMKNNPMSISIAIDPLQILVRMNLGYQIRGERYFMYPATPFNPFSYGLELSPKHKNMIELFRIDKETGVIKAVMVTFSSAGGGINTKELSESGNYYTIDRFMERDYKVSHSVSAFRKATKNMALPQEPNIVVESINFTKALPIEKEIMSGLEWIK